MDPYRYVGKRDEFETRRIRLNDALAPCGLQLEDDGSLTSGSGFAKFRKSDREQAGQKARSEVNMEKSEITDAAHFERIIESLRKGSRR